MNFGSAKRLAFIDVLRGLAALSVVLGHFTIAFALLPEMVAKIIMAEPIPAISLASALVTMNELFNPTGSGVGAFFMISGFVIPLSLDRMSTRAYLLKRLLRIFPTYWVSLAIGVAALFVSAAYWSTPVTYSWLDYAVNVFLMADFFARFDIPSVMWTLQIEMKFYLLAPLFHAALSKGSLRRTLLWGAGVAGYYLFATMGCSEGIEECWGHRYSLGWRMVAREGMYISYMLIGSVLYAHYRRVITDRQAAFGAAFLLACYLLSLPLSPFPNVIQIHGLPFVWGFVIFVFCYAYRDRISLTRPFRFLANISYPLYVSHALVGFITMRLLIANGLPYIPAFFVALPLVIAIALAIHIYVEAPSIALGKQLTARATPSSIQGAERSEVLSHTGRELEKESLAPRM